MTQFATIELLYNQFSNLVDEINVMIEKEDYNSAIMKLKDKDKLINKLMIAKKTAKFSPEESEKLIIIEQKIKEKEKNDLEYLTKIRDKTGEDIKEATKKVKINSAYDIPVDSMQGVYLDLSE